ncbi:MAG TPA: Ig-like domain-containing protein, partial [Thermoanaerobaculia bacterium]|nr:Ig-like domain-containing protein [Thermoanaerobaculia bacterium]
MTSNRRFAVVLAALFLLPIVASAATIEFRVLIDSDNNASTGCAVGGMSGVEHVLVTLVKTDATSGAVDRTYRLACVGGTNFGAPIDDTTGGWSVGFQPASGGMTVENRLPFSVLTPNGTPTNLRLGFDATTSGATHSATVTASGTPIIYPRPGGKRHSVAAPGGDRRFFQLDGNANDWGAITPLVNGIASGGSNVIRMIQAFAYANVTDEFIYFRIDANAASDAPFAEDDDYNRPPGESLSVPAPGVLANDGDPNGLPLTAQQVSDGAHGDVTLNADGSFTYQPNDPASTQTDTFQYKATNGTKESNVAKVTIKVSAVANHAPVAEDDSESTSEDTPLSVPAPGVLGNDVDADGDAKTATKLTDPSNGTVVVNADGSFTYSPSLNFFGTDSFTYTLTAGGETDTATVTITIEPVNDAPVVMAAAFSIDENSPNGSAVGTVSATDTEGDGIGYAITAGNTNNAFAIDNSGNITVANAAALDFEGTPVFNLVVTATDNGVPSGSGTGNVTITLNDLNETPEALGDAGSVAEDGSLNVPAPGLLANDSDPDGDSLTASKVTDPANGVATVSANGAWTYTPNANFFGTDSFTYQITDGSLTDTATVIINVTAVNDTPSFTGGGNVATDEDTAFSAPWATAISAGPANESGQSLNFNVSNDNNALFQIQPTITAAGVLSFTPAANANGSANVTVTLSDNGGGANTSASQNFVITVREGNDAPTANNDAQTTPEDVALVFAAATLTTNDSPGPANESGQTLTVTAVSATSMQGGTVTLVAGTITYTPAANYFGPD